MVIKDRSPFLGRDACVHFGLVKRVTNNVGRNQSLGIQSVHTKAPCFPSLSNCKPLPNIRCNEIVSNAKADGLFDGLCVLRNHKYDISLKRDIEPVQEPHWKVPHKMRDQVKTELDRMEQLGVHCKVTEPTDWASSVIIVHKPAKFSTELYRATITRCRHWRA